MRGFSYLVRRYQAQITLAEVPAHGSPDAGADTATARTLIAHALSRGLAAGWKAKTIWALFDCYGIPHVRAAAAKTADEAEARARTLGAPVALKILSPDIVHKSDVGGVALALAPAQVAQAARAMADRVRAHLPAARTRPASPSRKWSAARMRWS